jgi:hypothetical protein
MKLMESMDGVNRSTMTKAHRPEVHLDHRLFKPAGKIRPDMNGREDLHLKLLKTKTNNISTITQP